MSVLTKKVDIMEKIGVSIRIKDFSAIIYEVDNRQYAFVETHRKNEYGRVVFYDVYTVEESYPIIKKAVKKILEKIYHFKEGSLYTAGQHTMAKNVVEHLHTYFTLDYNEDKDCCEVSIIWPYDD